MGDNRPRALENLGSQRREGCADLGSSSTPRIPATRKGEMPDHQNLKMAETFMLDYENWLAGRYDSRNGVPQAWSA